MAGSAARPAARTCAPEPLCARPADVLRTARGDLPSPVVHSYISPLHDELVWASFSAGRHPQPLEEDVAMQPTTTGQNRTGAALHPKDVDLMLDAVDELSPQVPISTAPIDAERLKYIAEADSLGSIPPPASMLKGSMKKGMAVIKGISPSLFMDKIGERIAFERTGTRLYDALISKYMTLAEVGGEELPALDSIAMEDDDGEPIVMSGGETPLETLRRIRSEEHGHFLMLCGVMQELGGDPTAQTPCA